MARGLYKLDISATPYPPQVEGPDGELVDAPFGEVVEISRGTKWAYLYSGLCPHPGLVAMGATCVGEGWKQAYKNLPSAERAKVFDAEWEEDEDELDEQGQPTGQVRQVMRRGKMKDKPKNGPPPKLRDMLIPACFGSREGKLEQADIDRG